MAQREKPDYLRLHPASGRTMTKTQCCSFPSDCLSHSPTLFSCSLFPWQNDLMETHRLGAKSLECEFQKMNYIFLAPGFLIHKMRIYVVWEIKSGKVFCTQSVN